MASSNKAIIIIDVVLKGLQNVEKLGKTLSRIVDNKAVVNGFYRIYWAMGQVSQGAGKLVETLFRLLKSMGAVAQDPALGKMFRVLGVVLKSVRKEFEQLGDSANGSRMKLVTFDLMLGILAIQLRSLAFLIRDLGLNFLRFSQRVFAGVMKVGKAGAEIEYSFATLQALLNVPTQSSESFKSLTAEIVRVGEATSFTINEVAQLAGVLAQAGLSTKEIEQAIASVVQLAEAGGIAAEDAAEIATSIMHMFSLQAAELGRVNDVLTSTSIASNASVTSLANSFNYVGPLASSFGYSLEEVSAALGMLANAGQTGTRAGAGLAQVFSQLTSRADQANEILAKYGSSFDAINPSVKNITEILQEFERINFSTSDAVKLFGDRAQKTFLALRTQGSETLKNFTEMNKQATGLAKSIQDIKMDTVQGDVAKLNASIESLKNTLFTAIEPQIRSILQWLTKSVNAMAEWVRNSQEAVHSFFDLLKHAAAYSLIMSGVVLSISIIVRLAATLVTTWSTINNLMTLYRMNADKAAKSKMWSNLGGGGGGGKGGWFGWLKSLLSSTVSITGIVAAFTALGPVLAGIGTTFLSVILPALAIILPLLALLGGAIFLVTTNWDYFSKKIQWTYDNVWTPFITGITDGFTKAFYNGVLPAMEKWRALMEFLFKDMVSGDLEKSFYRFGEYMGELFGNLLTFVINIISYITVAIAEVNKLGTSVAAAVKRMLFGGPGGVGDAFGFFGKFKEKEQEKNIEMLKDSIAGLNDVLYKTSGVLFDIEQKVPALEAIASKVMRFSQLGANELKDLKASLDQLGPNAFSPDGIARLESDLTKAMDKTMAKVEELKEKYNIVNDPNADPADVAQSMRELREKFGVSSAQELTAAIAKGNSLIDEMAKKLEKLRFIKELAQQFKDIGKFANKDELNDRVKTLRDQIKELEDRRLIAQEDIFRTERLAIGEDGLESEVQRNDQINVRKKQIAEANERIQAVQEMINFLLTNADDILMNQNLTVQELIDKKIKEDELAEQTRKTEEEKLKLLQEQKEIVEELNKQREQEARQRSKENLDERSKASKEDVFSATDRMVELQEAYDKLQAQQDQFLEKGLINEANAVGKELDKIAIDMDNVQKDLLNKKKKRDEKYREDFENEELDMKHRLAEAAKDQAAEEALFTQKFNDATEKMIKDNYFDATTGKETAEAAKIRALRQQELANELAKIKEKYAPAKDDKDVADKAKEANEMQQKGLQILLDKVKTTADLIALQRALFKIQEMYDSKALENARRAQNAEQTLNSLMMRRAEMLARGESTAKLDEIIKRRTETANIKRGIADRTKKQAGISDATLPIMDQQAINNLTAAISAQLANIRLMLVNMENVFAAAASSWIDKFVEAWNNNSNKINDAILMSLTNAVSAVSTGDIFAGVPGALPSGDAKGTGKTGAPIQVTINGDDPQKIWRGLSRKLDQLRTQNA